MQLVFMSTLSNYGFFCRNQPAAGQVTGSGGAGGRAIWVNTPLCPAFCRIFARADGVEAGQSSMQGECHARNLTLAVPNTPSARGKIIFIAIKKNRKFTVD
jgi:hypothetical protein